MPNSTNNQLDYFRIQQIPAFCRDLLRALGDEFASQSDADTLRLICRGIGGRMAAANPLQAAATLDGLAEQINVYLFSRHWGWVSLAEAEDHLKIIHAAAPLREMFGVASLPWSIGLLEGLYEQWLRDAGAGDKLKLYCHGEDGESGDLEFRLLA